MTSKSESNSFVEAIRNYPKQTKLFLVISSLTYFLIRNASLANTFLILLIGAIILKKLFGNNQEQISLIIIDFFKYIRVKSHSILDIQNLAHFLEVNILANKLSFSNSGIDYYYCVILYKLKKTAVF